MLNQKMIKLFEANEDTGFLTLKKTEIDDATLLQHLAIKPTEINIILARVVSFIKGDAEKTKKDLINDILEVLERSAVAREFVGIGVQSEYRVYKGFPVRKGDPYESMQDPGSEMTLKPSELFIGWTTDAEKAREDSIKYDAAKGEPIGGLLVDVHVDISKVLFDINAVIRTVKAKKAIIDQYNQQAAPGKSLSKTNSDFLSNDAPIYHGMWEIITTNKITTVRVMGKWTWDTTTGQKKVKWTSSQPQTTPQQAQVKENIQKMFESVDLDLLPENLTPNDEIVDEGLMQGIKNVFGSIFGTTRMKNAKKISYFIKAHENEKQIYEKLREVFKLMGNQAEKVKLMETKVQEMNDLIAEERKQLDQIKSDTQQKYKNQQDLRTPEEKKADLLHQQATDIKKGLTNPSQQTSANSDREKKAKILLGLGA
jgi:hypothetical protein